MQKTRHNRNLLTCYLVIKGGSLKCFFVGCLKTTRGAKWLCVPFGNDASKIFSVGRIRSDMGSVFLEVELQGNNSLRLVEI